MKPATLWSRYQKDGTFSFNHLEDGHCPNDVPTPKDPSHNQVWKGKWSKEFVHLDASNKVIHTIISGIS